MARRPALPEHPPRYAESLGTQASLAERHVRVGGDHTCCYQRMCEVCGKVYYAAMPYTWLCSERCNQDAVLARRRAIRRAARVRTCGRCHETFVGTRRDAVYCSNACRQAAHRRRHSAGAAGVTDGLS